MVKRLFVLQKGTIFVQNYPIFSVKKAKKVLRNLGFYDILLNCEASVQTAFLGRCTLV